MAGHVRFTALLDACVLFPVWTCDALMSVAATGIYVPKWSAEIDREWTMNLAAHLQRPVGDFDRRRDCMHDACPDWEVPEPAWKSIAPCVHLPDADDRHVLAAAIAGHADCLVTTNLRDFPTEVLAPLGIEALHPDDFLVAQLELSPLQVLPAFKAMRDRLRNPSMTPEAFSDRLERNGLVRTAAFLRDAAALI
jgi:hypothetical protein